MSDSIEIKIPIYGAHPEKGSLVALSDIKAVIDGLNMRIEHLENELAEREQYICNLEEDIQSLESD